MRTIRYQQIANALREQLESTEFGAAQILPSEAELSRRFEASRVTIRRALEVLRSEGLIESRQGFGWIVSSEPLTQDLSHLDTIEAQLAKLGLESERKILSFGFVRPPRDIRESLNSDANGSVLQVRRVSLVDGKPFALVTVWCREDVGAKLSRDDVERTSFLEQLPVKLGGAVQTIGADVATQSQAELLEIPAGAPVLIAQRLTKSADGSPILVSQHIFPAHRTRFIAELPVDDGQLSPTGVQLLN